MSKRILIAKLITLSLLAVFFTPGSAAGHRGLLTEMPAPTQAICATITKKQIADAIVASLKADPDFNTPALRKDRLQFNLTITDKKVALKGFTLGADLYLKVLKLIKQASPCILSIDVLRFEPAKKGGCVMPPEVPCNGDCIRAGELCLSFETGLFSKGK